MFQLYYVDEDNDKIRVKLDLELSEALRYTQANNSILKIFVQSTFSPPPPPFSDFLCCPYLRPSLPAPLHLYPLNSLFLFQKDWTHLLQPHQHLPLVM